MAEKMIVEYSLFQTVKIKELERSGVVTKYLKDSEGLYYNVRYFDDGKVQEVYFLSHEIEGIK